MSGAENRKEGDHTMSDNTENGSKSTSKSPSFIAYCVIEREG
jgi:hypothetical protein